MVFGKILSALCYFSIFFAPFLCPIIIYFVVTDRDVRSHAKKALMLHILPTLLTIAAVIVGIVDVFGFQFSGISLLFVVVVVIVDIIAFIWNLVKGIQVLVQY